jgi:hypothetical protein
MCRILKGKHTNFNTHNSLDPPPLRTRVDYAIDENVTRYQPIVVLVHLSEQIRETRFFVIHEFQETLPPIVPAELTHTLNVLQVKQVFVQPTLSFPGHHPDVTPFVPQQFGAR